MVLKYTKKTEINSTYEIKPSDLHSAMISKGISAWKLAHASQVTYRAKVISWLESDETIVIDEFTFHGLQKVLG